MLAQEKFNNQEKKQKSITSHLTQMKKQVDDKKYPIDQSNIQFKLSGNQDCTSSVKQCMAERAKVNNTGLPDSLKARVEAASGFSMDDVKVHYNSSKPAQLQALAYTQGTQIYVAPGQERHLGHEAWHVVQQKQGRVSATTSVNGEPVNNQVSLEKEADAFSAKSH